MATVDRKYCASSYLMYRVVDDETKCFSEKYPLHMVPFPSDRKPIKTSADLKQHLQDFIAQAIKDKNRRKMEAANLNYYFHRHPKGVDPEIVKYIKEEL